MQRAQKLKQPTTSNTSLTLLASRRCSFLSQFSFKYFTCVSYRQALAKLNIPWIFVRRKLRLAPGDKFIFRQRSTLFQDDECLYFFAEPLVGHADHGAE